MKFVVYYLMEKGLNIIYADMVELADTYDSGSYALTGVQVRILLSALKTRKPL